MAKTLQNTAALFLARFITPFISSVLLIYLAAVRGADGVGEYAFVLSLLVIFQTLSSLGLSNLIIRETAKNKDLAKSYFFNALRILLLSAFCFLGLLLLTAYFISDTLNIFYGFAIAGLALFPLGVNMASESVFIAFEKGQYVTLTSLVEGLTRITLGMGFLYLGYDVIMLFVALVVSTSISAAFSIIMLFRKTPIGGSVLQSGLLFEMFRMAPAFLVISVFGIAILKLDTVILASIKGLKETGLYVAAYKFIEVGLVLLVSIGATIFPEVSETTKMAVRELPALANKHLKYVFIVYLPITIILFLKPAYIISFFFPPSFSAGADALRVLALALVPAALSVVLVQYLLANNYQWFDAASIGIGLSVNIVLDFALIPPLGYMGAAWATIFSLIVIAVLHYVLTIKLLFKLNLIEIMFKPLIAASIMIVFIILSSQIKTIFSILLSFVLYFFSLIVMRELSMQLVVRRELGDAD